MSSWTKQTSREKYQWIRIAIQQYLSLSLSLPVSLFALSVARYIHEDMTESYTLHFHKTSESKQHLLTFGGHGCQHSSTSDMLLNANLWRVGCQRVCIDRVCIRAPMQVSAKQYALVHACVARHLILYVCVCVCRHACMRSCMYVELQACTYACLFVCLSACLHACLPACLPVCVHTCMHACMYERSMFVHAYYAFSKVCTYICMVEYNIYNIHSCMCMYIYIYI